MASAIQVKGEFGVCSSMGTTEDLRKIKSTALSKKMKTIEETYNTYGANSEEFYVLIKPLITWTCYKHLSGMPFTEDLVNNAFMDVVIAFNGGKTSHYNKEVEKAPTYETSKRKNIGDFIMYVVGSAVTKYRSKNYRRQEKYEDRSEDISDRTKYTDFEKRNFLSYEINENIELPQFSFFQFNDAFEQHLKMLKETRPKNNILYNFMLWRSQTIGF